MTSPAIRIVIVRHGESSFNVEKRIQGRSDQAELTKKGSQQASLVRQALADLPFLQAYSSPLQRAYRTAEQIVAERNLPLTPSPLLREIDLTEWEGLTFEDVRIKFSTDYHLWRHHPHQLNFAGRYPVKDLWQQAQDFWQTLPAQIPQEGTGGVVNLLVVGHSGINRALIGTALGLNPSHYHHLGQDNCAISVLNFPRGLDQDPQLESLNITAHLGDTLPKSKGGLRLLLVRHGETQWNRDQRFQGQQDIPLNTVGEQQAQRAACFLRSQRIDLAFSSPLSRPWKTAEAICVAKQEGSGCLPLQAIPDLQEISHGNWEGKLQGEIEAEYPGLLQQWQTDPASVQMPCGENLHQVWARSQTAWEQILQETQSAGANTTALVVAHDAINKAILCQLFDLGPKAFWIFKQGNGAVTVIDYPHGADHPPVLKALNITTHLSSSILDSTAAGAL
jgi:probable phosphoglycerate mutase